MINILTRLYRIIKTIRPIINISPFTFKTVYRVNRDHTINKMRLSKYEISHISGGIVFKLEFKIGNDFSVNIIRHDNGLVENALRRHNYFFNKSEARAYLNSIIRENTLQLINTLK